MAGFKEYQMMFQLSATTSSQFQSSFAGAQSSIAQLQSKIDALNKQQGDISAYQKQQSAVEKTKSKLELLKQQYENLKKEMGENGKASADLQNKMLDKAHQIDKTSAALDQQTAKLGTMESALTEAGVDTNNLASESQRLEAELSDLRQEQENVADSAQEFSQNLNESVSAMEQALVAAGIVDGLKAIYDGLKECADAAIEYESAMASVKRTVGGSDSFISDLGDTFKELSTEIPISASELAGIATTAGQLGIAQENVEQFTTVMAQLATTTDLTADDAATMLAQFANITGTTQYDRLGSTVAQLGDATATTASKVVQMSQGMAAAASQAGMRETDILAISAAVGSLGIEAQAGSTAMSTLIQTLYKAVETGDGLEDFAAVAGMTASEFKTAWGQDAVGTMNTFIQGLNDTERNGRSAIVILDELGISNVRQTKAILGLASAGDLLSNTITQANEAWNSNTALADKAGVMYGTTEAKLTMMENAANNVKIAVGDALTPAMGTLAEVATDVLQPVAEFIERNPELVQALTVGIGIIGGVTAGILALSAAMKVAAAAGALMSAAIPGLPLILGITAGVAALAAGVVYLASVFGDSGKSFEELNEEFDDMTVQLEHEQHIVDLCDEYRQLNDELDSTGAAMRKMRGSTSVDIEVTAEVASTLKPEDFVDNTYIELTAEQANKLAAMDFIPDGTTITLTAESGNALAAAGFLDGTEVYLSAEAANELVAAGFLDEDVLQLYAEQGNTLDSEAYLDEPKVKLTAEMANHLAATGYLDTCSVPLTAEMANFLEAEGFLVDSEVELTPEAASLLAAEGFLDGTVVSLSPEAAERLTADGFLDGQTVTLHGEADGSSLLSSEDFVDGDTTVTITPSLGDTSQLESRLAELGASASAVESDLSSAKATLESMQSEYDELKLKMLATNESDEKSAFAKEMESLSQEISAQQAEVDALQKSYDSLNTEYVETQTAIDEVTAKQERLSEVKQELVESSDGLITATEGETEAFNSQVEALQALAEMKAADIRQQAYENIAAQSEKYAEAIQSEAENQALLNKATQDQAQALGFVNGGIDSAKVKLFETYQALEDIVNSDAFDVDTWNSDEVQGYVSQIENMLYLLTGEKHDFSFFDQIAYAMQSMNDASYENVESGLQRANADVEKYAQAVIDADGTQQEFLDNLVAGVEQGGMSLEYLEGILTEQFAGMENGEQIVADAMDYVRSRIEGAAEATEDMGDGMDGVSDSAYELEQSINPIIEQMQKLGQAYDEAYKSAYDSIDGQFELFEKVGKIKISTQYVNTGDNSMRESLESQAKYMEEYVSMLEKARDIGVNTDLLSELADGSAESAETLKRIVSESTTPEDIEALNASYELVQQKKAEFANAVAEIQTNFSEQMSTLEQQMTDTISKMNMSAEASANAQATFQSLVTQAQNMQSSVYNAFKRVADAANRALATIHAPSVKAPSIPGYAVGTESAAPGYAIVGENGPELVYFGGGEQIYTAEQTEAMTRSMEASPINANPYPGSDTQGTVYKVEFAPQYNFGGNTNAAELRAILEEHDAGMRAQLEELLDDIEADRARRAYV